MTLVLFTGDWNYWELPVKMCIRDRDVAFVIFNVTGKDLLAIDELNEFESEAEKKETLSLYRELDLSLIHI